MQFNSTVEELKILVYMFGKRMESTEIFCSRVRECWVGIFKPFWIVDIFSYFLPVSWDNIIALFFVCVQCQLCIKMKSFGEFTVMLFSSKLMGMQQKFSYLCIIHLSNISHTVFTFEVFWYNMNITVVYLFYILVEILHWLVWLSW